MTSPRVSIIIPCYNAGRFLGETLESVLAQTFHDYEVIVINDGSTDETAKVVADYRQRFKDRLVYETGPNRGVSAARNRGTELAKGRFLQYLDADDLLRPHALRVKVAALDSSGADVAYCDWQELTESPSGQLVPGKIHTQRCEDIHPSSDVAIIMDFWAPPAALLYRREIIARIGSWNTSLPIVQDGRFLFDAVYCGGTLRHVPGIGADYRVTQGSFSKRDPVGFMREWAEDALQVEALWRREGELTAARRRALLRRLGKTTSVLYEHDRPCFWKVFRHMQTLEPGYIPERTRKLRLVSRLVGYPRAEALALALRKLRHKIRL